MKKTKLMRVLVVVLIALFALGALAGCSANVPVDQESSAVAEETASAAPNTDAEEDASETVDGPKIGLAIYSTSDATSKPVYEQCKRAVEAMGGEFMLAIDDGDQEKQITQIENLISSGCQAVFFLPYSDDAVATLSKTFQENEVYFGMYWHALGADKEIVEANPYFLGNTYEDDVWSAYTAMKTLHDAGASKIGFLGLPKGRETTSLRDQGIEKACQEFGMEILVEDRNSNDASEAASSVESFLASYPEMDGIVIAGMTQDFLPGVMQTLSKLGLSGKVKVSGIDFHDAQTEYYEAGALNGMIGGHFSGPAYLASLAINKLEGNPLVEGATSIMDNFVVLESVEDAHNYDEYVAVNFAYSEEECAQWSVKNNPEFSYDKLISIVEAYCLDDILTRQGIE